MLRVWSEFLSFDEVARPEVLELLATGPVHPIVAVRPRADLDALAALIVAARARGLQCGIWPLLRDEEGYWPSERNQPHFLSRLDGLLGGLEARGARPDWVAVDLEPPLQQIEGLMEARWPVRAALSAVRTNFDRAQFQRACQMMSRTVSRLHLGGYRTLGVTFAAAAQDLRDGDPVWQDLMEAPWASVPWSRAGLMVYGSMIAGYSRGLLDIDDVRALHYQLLVQLARRFGGRAHASIGVTGVGKLGDEPSYERPEELARDAAAARAAGVEDLAIFCLEGLVGRPDAGAWIQAVAQAAPRAPQMTPRAMLALAGGRGARSLVRALVPR